MPPGCHLLACDAGLVATRCFPYKVNCHECDQDALHAPDKLLQRNDTKLPVPHSFVTDAVLNVLSCVAH